MAQILPQMKHIRLGFLAVVHGDLIKHENEKELSLQINGNAKVM